MNVVPAVAVLSDGSWETVMLLDLPDAGDATTLLADFAVVQVLDERGTILFHRNDHGELVRATTEAVSPASPAREAGGTK